MAEEFATFQLWQATSLALPGFGDALDTRKFQNTTTLKLDYCIPLKWSKKRTDTTGVQSEENVHPDTGPAGALVEIQFTVDRKVAPAPTAQNFLQTLILIYATQNTNSIFRRGFLGLVNTDNPELNVTTPTAKLGYRLLEYGQIDPIDFKSRQKYRVLLQLEGKASTLENVVES